MIVQPLQKAHWNCHGICNCHCRFCYGMFKGHAQLDTERALILIDRLKGHVEELVFGGGDPLLRRDLRVLIDCAFEKNLRVEIQTNAQLLSHEFVRCVKDRVVRWGFSLDSSNPQLHDTIRGRVGNYAKVKEAASWLAGEGIEWNLRTLVARPTLATIESIGEWLQTLQFKGTWYLLQYAAVGDEMHNRQQYEISDAEFCTVVQPIVRKYSQAAFRTLPVPDGDRRQIYFLIAPDGAVYNHPPSGHPYTVVGNILSDGFDDLLAGLKIDFRAHYKRYGIPEQMRTEVGGLAKLPHGALNDQVGIPVAKKLLSISKAKPWEPGT